MNVNSSDQLRIAVQECMDDFDVFSRHCLKVKAKSGAIVGFKMNSTQRFIHRHIESQRLKTGKVRALILKGRQMGCSTYIGGRFLWRVRFSQGLRCFILTHAKSATDNLFGMVKRYLEKMPQSMKPLVGSDSSTGLSFPNLDASYHVGTAGFKDTGVSETFQLFHASEAALWSNPEAIARGALQAVPDAKGTEVIGESTSRGANGWYYNQCQAAMRGETDYQFIFCPWYWMDEYRKEVPTGFVLNTKEASISKLYKLDAMQMAWRRSKIIEFSTSGADGEVLFAQEYPCSVEEAFQSGDDRNLIPAIIVQKAMKSTLKEGYGAVIIGVDPARFGDDRTAIVIRKGRFIMRVMINPKMDLMSLTGVIVRLIKQYKPMMVNIDKGGLGVGVIDRLHELGFSHVVGVDFGGRASQPDRYFNKRAEMWAKMKLWLEDSPCMLPNRDDLLSDLTAPRYSFDSNGRLKLERKEDMKKRGIRSPDIGDALGLTFAEEVADFDMADDMNVGYQVADSRIGI